MKFENAQAWNFREVAFMDFAFFVSVILSGVALDVFVHALIT